MSPPRPLPRVDERGALDEGGASTSRSASAAERAGGASLRVGVAKTSAPRRRLLGVGVGFGRRCAMVALPSPRIGDSASSKSSKRWSREGDSNARDDSLDAPLEVVVGLRAARDRAGVPTTASLPSSSSLPSKSSSSAKTFASIRSSRRSSMRSASSSRARNEDVDISHRSSCASWGTAGPADGTLVCRARLSDTEREGAREERFFSEKTPL